MDDQPLTPIEFVVEHRRHSQGTRRRASLKHMFTVRALRGDGVVERRRYSASAAYRLRDALSDAIDQYEEKTRGTDSA